MSYLSYFTFFYFVEGQNFQFYASFLLKHPEQGGETFARFKFHYVRFITAVIEFYSYLLTISEDEFLSFLFHKVILSIFFIQFVLLSRSNLIQIYHRKDLFLQIITFF